ncbi:MAG: ribbon-helix-helix protein, CopG family [Promethearchaeota archaeon]
MTSNLKTLQIRLPEDILKKVDAFIQKGFFKSRSHLLRDAVVKYVEDYNYSGEIPYIVGPFTPSEMEQLKKAPKEHLEIPRSKIKSFQDEIKSLSG